MAKSTDQLPVTHVIEPADQAELAEVLRDCHGSATPVYPIGGGTSLDYGLPARTSGVGLSLNRLTRIVDYPARDLTVTVEAGISVAALRDALAAEHQELPFDVPAPASATLGGVVATNWNGPRRYGCGTVRDFVIGVNAVDGRGMAFKGGGRVVKNVAGYDFCKLLTGSLGTLGVLSQLTFKLRPRCERTAIALGVVDNLERVETLLKNLVHSETRPCAIEWLGGPQWQTAAEISGLATSAQNATGTVLAVGFEGTAVEVDWMTGRLVEEWRTAGCSVARTLFDAEAAPLWQRLAEFSADSTAPLVLKASVVPSGVTRFVQAVQTVDPQASFQAHAGNGIVIARFAKFPDGGLTRSLLGTLQPAAAAAHGTVVIVSNPTGAEATRQSWWSGIGAPVDVMTSVKRQFDPKNLLNPGRFVFP